MENGAVLVVVVVVVVAAVVERRSMLFPARRFESKPWRRLGSVGGVEEEEKAATTAFVETTETAMAAIATQNPAPLVCAATVLRWWRIGPRRIVLQKRQWIYFVFRVSCFCFCFVLAIATQLVRWKELRYFILSPMNQ